MSGVPTAGLILQRDQRQLAELVVHPLSYRLPDLLASHLTICCWIYVSDPQPTQVIVNHGHRRGNEPGWSLYVQQGMVVASLRVQTQTITMTAPLPEGARWHHLTVGIDYVAGAIHPYLNGTAVPWQASDRCLDPLGQPAPQEGLVIGGYTDAAGGHFNYTFGRRSGDRVDDLRIYHTLLTEQEIARFYNPANMPPVASFSLQQTSDKAPCGVILEATATDPDGQVTAYWWDFGDGERGEGATVTHRYLYAGRYHIRLTVLDNDHGQAICERTVEIGGAAAPVAFTPVFVNGEDGYAGFRIPSIVAAVNGDLVAFAEGRVERISDSTRTIRIVCKRSEDDGRTWGALQVVGRYLRKGEEYAAIYPSPVVDTIKGTGRIILLYKQVATSEWELARGQGSSRMVAVFSDDHGRTWHDERDITHEIHRPDQWRIQIPTAGHAIQLEGSADKPFLAGRLFYSGSHTSGDDSVFSQRNYAFWSDDLGQSWRRGPVIEQRVDGTSAKGLNEAIAVELADGRVQINSRNYQQERPVGCRAVTIAEFDHEGQLHYQPTYHDESLIEPAVQASLLRYGWPEAPSVQMQRGILFANPAHKRARRNLTVRLSWDEGATWPISQVLDTGPSAYSDLVQQADGQIGVLYERGNEGGIYYGRFTLDWLTGSQVPG